MHDICAEESLGGRIDYVVEKFTAKDKLTAVVGDSAAQDYDDITAGRHPAVLNEFLGERVSKIGKISGRNTIFTDRQARTLIPASQRRAFEMLGEIPTAETAQSGDDSLRHYEWKGYASAISSAKEAVQLIIQYLLFLGKPSKAEELRSIDETLHRITQARDGSLVSEYLSLVNHHFYLGWDIHKLGVGDGATEKASKVELKKSPGLKMAGDGNRGRR